MRLTEKWYSLLNTYLFRKVKCENIVIGPDYNRNFVIKHPERLEIGSGTAINGDCYIHAWGGVRIGRFCHIGKGLTVFSHNHNYRSQKSIPYDEVNLSRPVTIGDAVWIGSNVTIAPGTTVGEGAILSVGSVVFGTVPPCAIVRGNPAQVIGYRDRQVYEKLRAENKFC